MHDPVGTGGMVNPTFVEAGSADGIYVALFLFVVDVPMAIYPGFQVVFVQVDTFSLSFISEVISVSQYIMVEYIDGGFRRDMCQVIL